MQSTCVCVNVRACVCTYVKPVAILGVCGPQRGALRLAEHVRVAR